QIEREVPEFPQTVRLITGASGGMLGAAHYVTSLLEEPIDPNNGIPRLKVGDRINRIAEELKGDYWTRTSYALVFNDYMSLLSPLTQSTDRGKVLERHWRVGEDRPDAVLRLGRTFAQLRPFEERGVLPSLVFTPMMV